ncbi:hypothetical protein MNBD_GAMMA12-722 [hydrothermal vent metagenome]|uniref:Metallo-beta-lactamase domain-containing protein n=1 Tax=hydrothermal vent metagenome TaxID=652676 RepID=A0A3B0YY99_9ZZZZ
MSFFTQTKSIKLAITLLITAGFTSAISAEKYKLPVDKVQGAVSVMVLGSGGPTALAKRASASYLIFIDGKPRILMDAGGGSYKNLALSGVNIADLDIVLLSHLHIDHMGDLSAFVKGIFFHNRANRTQRSLPIRIFGPGENGVKFPPPNNNITQYPATDTYVSQLYHQQTGIERYLNIFAKAIKGGTFSWQTTNISAKLTDPVDTIVNKDGLVIKALAVFHGPVPALAYRIEYKGISIVYSGDTNSKSNNMITLSQNANMVIYDTAITDTLPNLYPSDVVFKALHTTPSRMGVVCATANPKTLLLSHLTPVTSVRTKEIKKVIRLNGYTGKIKVAKDLKVYNFSIKH